MSEIPWSEVAKAVVVMGGGRLPPEELVRWLDALAGTRTHDSRVPDDGLAGSE